MTKLVRSATIADKVLSVLRIIVYVLFGVTILSMLVGIVAAPQIINYLNSDQGGTLSMTSGVLKVVFATSALSPTVGSVRLLMVGLIVALAVVGAIILRLIHHFHNLMVAMKEARPFSAESTSSVRRIGVLMIVSAFVTPLISLFAVLFMMNTTQLPDTVQLSAGYNINGSALVAGLLFLLLSLVFDHGAQLQKQSDETL